MQINVNDTVRVKLNENGIAAFNQYYTDLNCPPPVIRIDENGFTTFQLHEVMNIFGKLLWCGSQRLPFADNCIHTT